jgi:hypothetical protein
MNGGGAAANNSSTAAGATTKYKPGFYGPTGEMLVMDVNPQRQEI